MDKWELGNCFYQDDERLRDAFFLEESLHALVATGDSVAMFNLAAHYYDREKYGLALKYFEMARDHGEPLTGECLGNIWYFGYTGKTDYKKAYEYYSQEAEYHGIARVRLADMHREGHYVEQDDEKYRLMIEEMYYYVIEHPGNLNYEADVLVRMARIRLEDHRESDAALLFLKAKESLEKRMELRTRPEDVRLMKSIKIVCEAGEGELFDKSINYIRLNQMRESE